MWEAVWWLVTAPVLLAVIGVYLSWTAGRVDRMHARVDTARATLDAQLQRRSGIAIELAGAGVLDPASAVLVADSAHRARAAPTSAQELAESDLTKSLVAAFGDPEDVAELRGDATDGNLVDELAAASKRVQLARRFHNDAVRAARALRSHRLVRWLRLAGRAPMPQPDGLRRHRAARGSPPRRIQIRARHLGAGGPLRPDRVRGMIAVR